LDSKGEEGITFTGGEEFQAEENEEECGERPKLEGSCDAGDLARGLKMCVG